MFYYIKLLVGRWSEMAADKITPEKCFVEVGSKVVGVDTEKASDMLLQDYPIIHLVDNKQTYLYSNGVYCEDAESFLEKVLYVKFSGLKDKWSRPLMTARVVREVMARTCRMATTSIESLQNNAKLLNLNNCVLDLDSMSRHEHSPEFKLFTKLPVDYDPEATCPGFLQFLDEVVKPEYLDVVGEMMGYTLWPDHNIHKAFMLLGPKRTGKSTLIRVIEALNGRENCSHVSLQDLMSQRFARARLFNHRVNTYGDLPAIAMSDVGVFKNVTGEDEIDAEYKGTQIFSFRNTAKLIYSANMLPSIKINDDAFYNRWIIIPFERSFYGHEDTHLTEKLTEELSGILNFALAGLMRLRKNDWKFSDRISSGDYYQRKTKPVIAFLEDCCERSDGYVAKADLLVAYNRWAIRNGYPVAPSRKAFGMTMLDQTVIPVNTYHPRVGDKQVEAWSGIRIKPLTV